MLCARDEKGNELSLFSRCVLSSSTAEPIKNDAEDHVNEFEARLELDVDVRVDSIKRLWKHRTPGSGHLVCGFGKLDYMLSSSITLIPWQISVSTRTRELVKFICTYWIICVHCRIDGPASSRILHQAPGSARLDTEDTVLDEGTWFKPLMVRSAFVFVHLDGRT